MGLGGRKVKQRIGADPRNLSWADNAAKFGQSYLSKLGWDPSKGLGANQDGRTSHVKVSQKLNMLGIGAGAPQGPDAIAWKQNRDYELLLARLNEANKEETGKDVTKDDEMGEASADAESELVQKRKREDDNDKEKNEEERKREKKRAKKERKEKKEKKKEKNSRSTSPSDSADKSDKGSEDTTSKTPEENQTEVAAPTPRRHLAHRARFLRSKQLALRSSTAVAEILGISPSVSGSVTPAFADHSSSSTPFPDAVDESVKMEQLTTATKSVADYFKEKLAVRSKSGSATPVAVVAASTSVAQDQSKVERSRGDDEEMPVRFGIGASRTAKADDELPKAGLGSGMEFGNLLGGMAFPSFAPSTLQSSTSEEKTKEDEAEDPSSKEIKVKKKKKDKKEKRKKSEGGDEPKISTEVGEEGESESADPSVSAKESESDEKKRKEKKREKKEKKRKDKPSS